MNIIEELKIIVFAPPRTGTRSISSFFQNSLSVDGEKYKFKYGYCEDHPNPYVFHHWVPQSLDYRYPRAELLKEELKLLLDPKYEEYQWVSTMRHPVSRYKSVFNWWLSGKNPAWGVKLYKQPYHINRVFHDYIVLEELSKLKNIMWIRTENIAEDMLQLKIDIDKYPQFIQSYEKYFLNNNFSHQMECKIDFEIKGRKMNEESEFDINLLEEKHIDYCYKKYRFIYDKHGYEKYPEIYKPTIYEPQTI